MVFLRRNKSQAQRIDQSGISLDGMRKIFGRSTPDSDEQNLICFNFNNRENEPFCFSGDESIFTPASKVGTCLLSFVLHIVSDLNAYQHRRTEF